MRIVRVSGVVMPTIHHQVPLCGGPPRKLYFRLNDRFIIFDSIVGSFMGNKKYKKYKYCTKISTGESGWIREDDIKNNNFMEIR